MNLKQVIDTCNSEKEIDDNCVDVFVNDYIRNTKEFLEFPLSKYFIMTDIHLCEPYDNLFGVSKAMKEKLKSARDKGRGGWWKENCSVELLYQLLEEHKQKTNKGNDIDLCNFSMFIYFKEFKK
jgi:hypothetical protein